MIRKEKKRKLKEKKMASIFADVEVGPKIEVFALTKAFVDDPSLIKVNLSVGGKLFTSICVQ